jgi:IS5 family transposase
LESASPHEVTLAEATLQEVSVPRPKGQPRQKPERVIADNAYDSDPLRQRLQKRGIELIAPYRENRQTSDLSRSKHYQTSHLLLWSPKRTLAQQQRSASTASPCYIRSNEFTATGH